MNYEPVGEFRPNRPRVGHGVHFMITLFTCGAWLPIWILIAFIDWARGPRTTVIHQKSSPTQK